MCSNFHSLAVYFHHVHRQVGLSDEVGTAMWAHKGSFVTLPTVEVGTLAEG